jgi:hypothetical protein
MRIGCSDWSSSTSGEIGLRPAGWPEAAQALVIWAVEGRAQLLAEMGIKKARDLGKGLLRLRSLGHQVLGMGNALEHL